MLATTRGEVLRGTTTDAYGDEVDSITPVDGLDDLAVSIIERDRREYDPASGTTRVVRELVGRVRPASADIRDGDRLRDKRTGIIYIIDEKTPVRRSISGRRSLTLALRAVGE